MLVSVEGCQSALRKVSRTSPDHHGVSVVAGLPAAGRDIDPTRTIASVPLWRPTAPGVRQSAYAGTGSPWRSCRAKSGLV
jgi:hypothetical protein